MYLVNSHRNKNRPQSTVLVPNSYLMFKTFSFGLEQIWNIQNITNILAILCQTTAFILGNFVFHVIVRPLLFNVIKSSIELRDFLYIHKNISSQ